MCAQIHRCHRRADQLSVRASSWLCCSRRSSQVQQWHGFERSHQEPSRCYRNSCQGSQVRRQ
ncbi:hypothetical protein FVEG_14116 [Fusarium verticillioides 7600]|uniref:Uncharacterized protein n=1 Tax=Gibberella moniliformis (strain M3125 / FGSC 7600) TaxID=334819 RepID=W7N8E7_GIBM7|nr:hypothetical protein FVEG_14116 [Fusarium verticillioides 7600]EWG56024.1 hypothetical protein FVEG_14116 [Fusarium verticillioides 7600]